MALFLMISLEVTEFHSEKLNPVTSYDDCYLKESSKLLLDHYNCTVLQVFDEHDSIPLCHDEKVAKMVGAPSLS